MSPDANDTRTWLMNELRQRQSVNRSYSLRAFARFLKLSPGRLSEILSGKRRLSVRSGKALAERLGYGPDVASRFLARIQMDRKGGFDPLPEVRYQSLSMDGFKLIADWQHFAILNLFYLNDFESNPQWMAKRLGLSVFDVRDALERLTRLELIEVNEKGKLKRKASHLSTTHDVSSAALRKSHRQSLEQAIASLEEVPVELRDITSMTMAIDASNIPLAKEMIRKFRRKLAATLENGPRDEVYNLNIQLVPVTKKRKMK